MKKKSVLTITLLSALLFSALAGTVHFSPVDASTDFSGIISSDTTWTKASSPYSFTGPVLVSNGVILTIQPGVTVNLNSYYILVNGTLRAQGTASDLITIKGGGYNAPNWGLTFSSFSSNWSETDDSGCVIENAVLNVSYTSINNSPKITNNVIIGYIIGEGGSPLISNNDVSGSISNGGLGSPVIVNNNISGSVGKGGTGSIIISNNTITGPIMTSSSRGPPHYYGNAIYLDGNINASISGNSISGYFDDTAISINGGTSTIEWNLISNSYGYSTGSGYLQGGFKIASGTRALIQNNTITKNAMGIYCGSDLATIVYNNILDNSNYNIYLRSGVTNNVNATYNWWGTTDAQSINQTIYDFKNDFSVGTVNFLPLLDTPNPAAPTIPSVSPTPTPSSTPTFTPTPTPTATPTQPPSPSPSPSQNPPTASPSQSNAQSTPQGGLNLTEIVILAVLIVIATLLTVNIAIALKKRRQQKKN
jgi:hypothetical protein